MINNESLLPNRIQIYPPRDMTPSPRTHTRVYVRTRGYADGGRGKLHAKMAEQDKSGNATDFPPWLVLCINTLVSYANESAEPHLTYHPHAV